MQEIIGIRDKLRADIEELDGGYTTVAKLMRKTAVHVHRTLREDNTPRLATLEEIKDAYDEAKKKQDARIERLNA